MSVVNFARCYHPDIGLLVLHVLQMETSATTQKFPFWCLYNIPFSLVPGKEPVLQWETRIGRWVSDCGVTFSEEIHDNFSFKETDNKLHKYLLHLRTVRLDFFVTHWSTLTALSILWWSWFHPVWAGKLIKSNGNMSESQPGAWLARIISIQSGCCAPLKLQL